MIVRCVAALLWLSAAAASAAIAAQPAPAVARLTVVAAGGDELRIDDVVAGSFDSQFLPVRGDAVRLPGDPRLVHWLRVAAPAATDGDASRRWVLALDPLPAHRLDVHVRGGDGALAQRSYHFFQPERGSVLPGTRIGFRLPERPGPVYLAVAARVPVTLSPMLLDEREFLAGEIGIAAMLAGVYAAIGVIGAGALTLFFALRERAYGWFAALTAVLLLLLAAVNGHLYVVPGVAVFGWWGAAGIAALGMAAAAVALAFASEFLHLPAQLPRTARWLRWGALALALLAVLALFRSLGPTVWWQRISATATLAALVAIIVASLQASRAGQRQARGFALVFLLIALALLARAGYSLGWLAPDFLAMYAWQIVLASGVFLLSIAIADRVMEFRKQRDRARLAKEQTDASLEIEQSRRELVEGLYESLRTAPRGDLEWLALKRLLAVAGRMLPNQRCAVVAYGYHDLDLMLPEPADAKRRFGRLLSERGGHIKGICRGRTPMQVRIDEWTSDGGKGGAESDAEGGDADAGASLGGVFAVVPLPMAKPAWGALLIERAPWEEFTSAELKLAVEFAQLTIAAADEAAGQLELRRRAQIDPLTGVFNRRAAEAVLDEVFDRALRDRLPVAVLFIDLDHFKAINDTHGHAAGDECLKLGADCIGRQLQSGDVLARYGGEEFLVLLTGKSLDQARELAERIRAAVAELRVRLEDRIIRFTVSIGVGTRLAEEDDPAAMVERADRALYAAKRNGRNRVQVAGGFVPGAGGPPEPLVL